MGERTNRCLQDLVDLCTGPLATALAALEAAGAGEAARIGEEPLRVIGNRLMLLHAVGETLKAAAAAVESVEALARTAAFAHAARTSDIGGPQAMGGANQECAFGEVAARLRVLAPAPAGGST